MTVVHHLDDATLLRFASGDLDEAFATVVAAHVALCAESRERLQNAEMYGGHLLANSDEVALDENAVDRIRAQIHETNANAAKPLSPEKTKEEAETSNGTLPAPLQRYVGPSIHNISWKTVAPGIKKHEIRLQSGTNSKLFMLHIAAGKQLGEHGHNGAEMALVLSGAFQDEYGRFGPGDVSDLGEDDEHRPKIEDGAPCICLVAAEGLTKPKRAFERWLQPLTGI